MSIVRWITFTDSEPTCNEKNPITDVPTAATFAAVFLFGSMGFVNVLLLLTTRQTLLLFDDPRDQRQVRLRRAAGGALEVGDDNVQPNVNRAGPPAPSPTDILLGWRNAIEGDGTNRTAGDPCIFNENDMDADGLPPFNGGEVTRSRERAASLDSGRDEMRVVMREMGRRRGRATMRNNTDTRGP